MKRKTCVICHKARGKRECKIRNNELICPRCCAKIRTSKCTGCRYYSQSVKYRKEKKRHKSFIKEVSPEITERVNNALELMENGNEVGSMVIFDDLLEDFPHIDDVQFGMGVFYMMKNEFAEAVPYFEKAIEIDPNFLEAWFNKAACHRKLLEIEKMVYAYREVIEYGNSSEKYVIDAQKSLDKLEKHLLETDNLSLDEYIEAMQYFEEAFSKLRNRYFEAAIPAFKKVLSIYPTHIQSYGNLGLCYAHLGKNKKALENLDKALELDPNYEPAIQNKKAIASLAEGEIFPLTETKIVDYYKDSKDKS